MSTNSAAAGSSPAQQIISDSAEIFSSIELSLLVSGVCEKSIVSMIVSPASARRDCNHKSARFFVWWDHATLARRFSLVIEF